MRPRRASASIRSSSAGAISSHRPKDDARQRNLRLCAERRSARPARRKAGLGRARRGEGAPRRGVAGQALRRRPRLPDHGIRRGSDPAFALVELDPSGRITLSSQAVEIGTGIATALAVRVAEKLGTAADEVKLGDLDSWGVLGLTAPDDPFSITAERQDEAAKDPRWVLDVRQDTTACNGAHVHTEAAAEAANIILRFGLFPAAMAIWSARTEKATAFTSASRTCASSTGRITARGLEPLALAELAAKAHEMGFVTSAMVHSYNRWAWATAAFDLPDGRYEGAIDALAVKYGNGAARGPQGADDHRRLPPSRPRLGQLPAGRARADRRRLCQRCAAPSSPSRSTGRAAPSPSSTASP